MKNRKPDKFSDSKITKESKLNRTLLEYQLDSLTSRKQEYEFEEFVRKLCQFEICPDLRPQTGPTGGGDGKVDTETTPKSKELVNLYYLGKEKSINEEWAFAFSAKKGWVQKVKDDIKKIAETQRGYKKIFFITNQYAKASKRAEIEDDLSKQYKIKVTIHDRTWLLDKVFENKREKLAIKELNLGDGLEEKVDVGPLDFQKEKKLKELTESIETDVVSGHVSIKTVDDVLYSAILTAELEKPKSEILGNFDRAISFAKDSGTSDQLFTAMYQKAWTIFFWLEDFDTFLKLYDEVESKALGSNNIFSVERLRNLWTLLSTLARTSDLISTKNMEQKTKNLQKKLELFKNNSSHISASVQAEEMLLFMNLILNIGKKEIISKTFKQLLKVIEKANLLIGFPFEPSFKIINEMEDIFSGNEEYEKLQERIVEINTQRYGDVSTAEMLYSRGRHYYDSGQFYKSINYLGKALYKFYKKESKEDLVCTLFLLSMAYEDAGLLWSARGALINAASYATSDFWIYSEINRMQIICYERLRTIELRLGNVGYALEWHRLNRVMASQLIKSEEDKKKFLEDNLHFGLILGLLLIKTPDEELKSLELLPDLLFSLDLDFAALGLIFRLGCHELLPSEFVKDQTPEDIQSFFDSYLTQPAQEALPQKPFLYEGEVIKMKSKILGSEFIVEVPNSSPEIELGEYFLAALESFLATSMSYDAVSRDRQVFIYIKRDNAQKKKIKYEIRTDSKLGIDLICKKFNPHKLTLKEQKEIAGSFSEAVLQLIAHSILFRDPKADLLKLFRDEEVSYRAFNFSSSLITLGNLLGYTPKSSITKWISEEYKKYPYISKKSGKPITNEKSKSNEPVRREQLRHDEIENVSIIRQHLWDQAGWRGVMYCVPSDSPPILALMFDNKNMAEAIFKDWIETFSREDKDELIRIAMLRGISRKNPSWYRAIIGINLKNKKLSTDNIITVSRVHTLEPDSTRNLDGFSKSFNRFGVYLLAPVIVKPSKQNPNPEINTDLGIVKKSFEDRHAWEVGPNDLDLGGINEKDDIIIPEGTENPPVLKLIKWRLAKKGSI
ncbi:MAG TPA: hypothetical protein VNW29_01995 [Candidatus Sulfotelmatobacter sp.]|nr:hypothetical protein [Candidatus Sulfotelmatobacter sp.]